MAMEEERMMVEVELRLEVIVGLLSTCCAGGTQDGRTEEFGVVGDVALVCKTGRCQA